ncbi:MAG: septum formation initiator family protein [Candidatus Fournierella pullistercoris]|uniref:Septum formation initiator family protein n=1 Tax=Candidatus Allofournierella pullistercoris TaxID=2838597 RepID=A0A948T1W5_9FIRM|nr:septum formation initiator family protein [Candidatus Fournierella pullistercoris]
MAMAKKEKKSLTVSTLTGAVLVVAIFGYLVVGMVLNQVEINAKRQQLEAVQQQLDAQLAENEELSRILESGTDEELIERVARDKLGYARPNERVFVDATGK